jgi:hypothetical protein
MYLPLIENNFDSLLEYDSSRLVLLLGRWFVGEG